MRKLLLAGLVAAIATAPFAGYASGDHDIEDAKECSEATSPSVQIGVVNQLGDPTTADPTSLDPMNADRGSVCVNDGSGNVTLYVGGEAVSESNPGEETGVACGAVIVNGEVLAGDETKNFNSGQGHHHCQ